MTNQDNCKITENDFKHTLMMGSTRAGMTGMSAITERMARLMSDMMNDVLAAAGGTPAVVDVGHSMEALASSRKATPYWRQFDKRKF